MNNIRDVLTGNFLFENVDDTVFDEFSGKTATYKKDDIIYEPTSFSHSLGIVISGRAAAVKNGNVILRSFCPGDTFGAAALFGAHDPYVSTIIAVKPSEILFITEEMLDSLFIEYPQMSVNYIRFLSSRIRFLNDKIALFTQDNVKKRLYAYFLSDDQNGQDVTQKINMSALSKTLNIGRTSLYRALGELEAEGFILINDGKVKVRK